MLDSFPSDFQNAFIARIVSEPKNVLKHFSPNSYTPKVKRIIILGRYKDLSIDNIGYVFINSEHYDDEDSLYFEYEGDRTAYLDKPSYIACSDIYEESFDNFLLSYKNDSTTFLAKLSESDFKTVKAAIAKSRQVSTILKKRYKII